jgi:hypothetical protein
MININVAKELVKMYDNLTLEDFEREWCDGMCGSNILQTFTGFEVLENVYCVKRLRH